MADHTMVGKQARVTGAVGDGLTGEVMVRVRGGSEAFIAYLADPSDGRIDVHTQVVVVDYLPPRTVLVSRM